ncbi:hypothetical protein FB451DRAFT_1258836 [Mycena latifolia]|nr:hypothetical protein FB451DRAFT_1258836 [Mycena latifolia]
MDPGSVFPPGLKIVEVSGPLLLAHLAHWGLFGALSVQLYLYYQAFPNDRPFTKCLVYGVYVIELVDMILVTRDAFEAFGYGFGDVSALTKINLGWLDIPIMSGLVSFIAQSFYAYRIYVLSKSWFIPVLIVVVSLVSSVGAFLAGIFTLEANNFARLNTTKFFAASGVWWGASALSDMIIAICMTYYLSKHITGFRETRALVSKLMRLTLETGSLTALVAMINFAIFYAVPSRTYYLTPTTLMPNLYANCILVVLNSRCQIVGGRGTDAPPTDILSAPTFLRDLRTHAASVNSAPMVTIDREVWSDEPLHNHVEMKRVEATDLDASV